MKGGNGMSMLQNVAFYVSIPVSDADRLNEIMQRVFDYPEPFVSYKGLLRGIINQTNRIMNTGFEIINICNLKKMQ